MGRTAGPRRRRDRLHRQPLRAPVQPRGAAHARRPDRDRRADRRDRPARRRLPDGPVRDDGPGRHRRRLRGREVVLGAELPRAALAAEPDPGEDGRRRPAGPQVGPRLLRLRRRPAPRRRSRQHRAAARRTSASGRATSRSISRRRRRPTVLERIVCQLVNEAASRSGAGSAAPTDIDTAMRLGFNWPRGPLAWGDAIGAEGVLSVLDRLRSETGEERYRAAPLLRRRAAEGRPLREDG